MKTQSLESLEGLGNWTELVAAGAGIFDSILDTRNTKKSNESAERQTQLQLEAQQSQAEATQKLVKLALIGTGALLFGGILISAFVRSNNSHPEPKPKKENLKGMRTNRKKRSVKKK